MRVMLVIRLLLILLSTMLTLIGRLLFALLLVTELSTVLVVSLFSHLRVIVGIIVLEQVNADTSDSCLIVVFAAACGFALVLGLLG